MSDISRTSEVDSALGCLVGRGEPQSTQKCRADQFRTSHSVHRTFNPASAERGRQCTRIRSEGRRTPGSATVIQPEVGHVSWRRSRLVFDGHIQLGRSARGISRLVSADRTPSPSDVVVIRPLECRLVRFGRRLGGRSHGVLRRAGAGSSLPPLRLGLGGACGRPRSVKDRPSV